MQFQRQRVSLIALAALFLTQTVDLFTQLPPLLFHTWRRLLGLFELAQGRGDLRTSLADRLILLGDARLQVLHLLIQCLRPLLRSRRRGARRFQRGCLFGQAAMGLVERLLLLGPRLLGCCLQLPTLVDLRLQRLLAVLQRVSLQTQCLDLLRPRAGPPPVSARSSGGRCGGC